MVIRIALDDMLSVRPQNIQVCMHKKAATKIYILSS